MRTLALWAGLAPAVFGCASAQPAPGSVPAHECPCRAAQQSETSAFTPAKRRTAATPEYPSRLKAGKVEGHVRVAVTVDTAGRVRAVRVVESSGTPEFDESARRATLQDQFEPAIQNGKPIETTLEYTTYFRLLEND